MRPGGASAVGQHCVVPADGCKRHPPLKTPSDLVSDVQTFTHQAAINQEAFKLVLRILTRSGLVMEVPDAPQDRYQLVHDYLAEFIRSLQQPLMAQLEEERQKRKVAEQARFAEQQKRVTAERQRLKRTQQAAVGLGALALVRSG